MHTLGGVGGGGAVGTEGEPNSGTETVRRSWGRVVRNSDG